MSHRTIVSAWAIALALSGVLPAALATHEPASLRIVSPESGGILLSTGSVLVEFTPGSGASGLQWGQVRLNGTVVGSFMVYAADTHDPTLQRVDVDAAALPRGAYALDARVGDANGTTAQAAPVWVLLNHAPRLEAAADYDVNSSTLRVRGSALDDAGGVLLLVTTPLGASSLVADGEFSHSQTGYLQPGKHAANVTARDGDGAERHVTVNFTVGDRPSTFTDLHVAAVRGERFHVHGGVSDPDGPVREVRLETAYGKAGSRVANGSFWIDLPVEARVGVHKGTLVASTQYGETRLPVEFEVHGVRRVFYEETVDLRVGAYSNLASFRLPDSSYGTVSICHGAASACSDESPTLAGVVAVTVGGGAGLLNACATAVGAKVGFCTFDARRDGTYGNVVWDVAGYGRVRVVVEGFEIT